MHWIWLAAAPGSLPDECEASSSADDVARATAAASVAAVLDLPTLPAWHLEVMASLRCTQELLSQEQIARLHRMQGAVSLRQGEDVDAGVAWQAARTVFPALMPLPGAPEGWARTWEMGSPAGSLSRLPTVPGAEWLVNGLATPVRTANRPAVIQLVDNRSTVLWSGWLAAGAPEPASLVSLIERRQGPRTVVPPIAQGFRPPFVAERARYADALGDRVPMAKMKRMARYDADGGRWVRRRKERGWLVVGASLLTAGAAYTTYVYTWDATVGRNLSPELRPVRVAAPASATILGGVLVHAALRGRRRARLQVVEAAERVANGEAR